VAVLLGQEDWLRRWLGVSIVNTAISIAWKAYYAVVNVVNAVSWTSLMVKDLGELVHTASSADWKGAGKSLKQIGDGLAGGVGGMTTFFWEQLQLSGEMTRDDNGWNALHHTFNAPWKGCRQIRVGHTGPEAYINARELLKPPTGFISAEQQRDENGNLVQSTDSYATQAYNAAAGAASGAASYVSGWWHGTDAEQEAENTDEDNSEQQKIDIENQRGNSRYSTNVRKLDMRHADIVNYLVNSVDGCGSDTMASFTFSFITP